MSKSILPANTLLIVLVAALAGLLVGALGGYAVSAGRNKTVDAAPVQSKTDNSAQNSYFDSVSAYVRGSIAAVNGNSLTFKSALKDGATQTFKISPTIFIVKSGSTKGKVATSSGQINNLDLNKDVTLTLQYQNNEYIVTSAVYKLQ